MQRVSLCVFLVVMSCVTSQCKVSKEIQDNYVQSFENKVNRNDAIAYRQISKILQLTSDIDNKLGVLTSQCDNLQGENKMLKTNLITAETKITQLSAQLEDVMEQDKLKEAQLADLKNRLETTTTENTQIRSETDSLSIVSNFRQSNNLLNENTVIMEHACDNAEVEVVAALLDLGFDCEKPLNSNRDKCLHFASYGNYLTLVKFLLSRGCDIEARSRPGWTPLMSAAEGGGVDVGKFLVEKGAQINARTYEGKTPLFWAGDNKNYKFAKFLKSKGASL